MQTLSRTRARVHFHLCVSRSEFCSILLSSDPPLPPSLPSSPSTSLTFISFLVVGANNHFGALSLGQRSPPATATAPPKGGERKRPEGAVRQWVGWYSGTVECGDKNKQLLPPPPPKELYFISDVSLLFLRGKRKREREREREGEGERCVDREGGRGRGSTLSNASIHHATGGRGRWVLPRRFARLAICELNQKSARFDRKFLL